jgi:hypothetical protein
MLRGLRARHEKGLEIDDDFEFGSFAVQVPANYNKL